MVGLILVIIVASVNWSFQSSIVGWFDRVIHADFLVSSYGRIVAYQVQPLNDDLGREIEKTPGILMGPERGAYALRFIHFQYEGHQLGIKAFDEPTPSDHYNYFYVRDRSNMEAGQALFHSTEPTVLVSENFVQHFHKKYGDMVDIPSPSGTIKFKIVGGVTDFASPEGIFYMDRKTYKKYWKDSLVEGFSITAMPGYNKEKLREAIDSRFGKKRNLMVISNNDMREQIVKSIDKGFGYTRAIEIAALAVALLSLLNTFLISVMERTRELGMLRAVGMTRSQMMGLIIQESLVQGGFGALVAVILGAWVAELWIVGSLSYVLGWIIHFSFPWQSVITTVFLGIGVTLLAGLYPAWRAAHIEIREALEYE
jgi:putative ABC transport system permease protein